MQNIPSDTLAKILELRTKNGLTATAEAVEADLANAKCKWTLVDTPRYRRAGDSPIYISGKYLTAEGTCPATGETDAGRTSKPVTPRAPKAATTSTEAPASTVDEGAFYRVLHGKGFKIRISKDLITGEIQQEVPESIARLNLKFGNPPQHGEGVYVTRTSPQIQVSMTLDQLLELARLVP